MNSLKTLIFPATVIHSIRQYPIFLLFDKIHMISPVEAGEIPPTENSTDSFINSGLCQVDTPCPLGENRKRFLHLVADIRNRKDDYAAQLSALTLTAMSSAKDSGEESERAIINGVITPKNKNVEETEKRREAKLWQARLVLAIGEILDAEEEEIARNLAALEDDTADLFEALHGEMDDPEENSHESSPFSELTELTSKFSAVHGGNMAKRLTSWTQLFAESNLTDADIFLTTSPDVHDIVAESYNNIAKPGSTPRHLEGLELPGLIGWNEKEAVQAVHQFQADNQQFLSQFNNVLGTLKEYSTTGAHEWEDVVSALNEALENSFPKKHWGRLSLTISIFDRCSIRSLLSGTTPNEPVKNGILLVVS
ncbi:hypothetical protein [Desulforhopalus sp. IMCC35007]|uniref:hypothetical protein n=1 Tax=Desulforhopalus sp. IMCC35007 TaxID=2569543 RepID=UPI0010AEDD74|nr:hypothetical protein [Desulforhopalus sp. IMCC35007]TKB08015.1 hypothetical protein FCL48_15285 [Desulforhopalus sp. IMCC35007]